MLELWIENFGPIEELRLEIDVPLVILTGETGTGKSLLLRVFSLLLKNLPYPLDNKALESDFINEFGHPLHLIARGAEEAKIVLSYNGEALADIELYRHKGRSAGFLSARRWKGGTQPYLDLAARSIIVPDERINFTRRMFSKDDHLLNVLPSEKAYCTLLMELCKENSPWLEEILAPMFEEDMLPNVRSYCDRGLIAGYEIRNLSSAALSLLSLAPILARLDEGRALLVAVDTVELHLTPLLQAVVSVNLARWAKRSWLECEEYPPPLLLVTHSSIVLAALQADTEEGVKDKLVRLEEKYRPNIEDIKTVVLYRERGVSRHEETKGVALPTYLREYSRFI